MLIVAFFFIVTLCIGDQHVGNYNLPITKRIAGSLLIIISILNFIWDITIVIDTQNSIPIIDREMITSRLGCLKYVPNLHNMSEENRVDWRRNQIIEGKINSNTSLLQEEILYNNQVFIEMFGEEAFSQYTYDQRQAIIEDSINKYNAKYIDLIFIECLSPFENDGTFNPQKGLGSQWTQFSDIDTESKYRLLKSYITDKNQYDSIGLSDLALHKLKIAFCVFVTLLGWGIYTLKSKPNYSPIWKRIIKVLIYIASTIVLFCSATNNPISEITCVGIEFGLMVVIILLNFSRVKTHPNDFAHKNNNNLLKVICKIIISLLIPTLIVLALLWSDDGDIAPWLCFYLPYYIFLLGYFEWIIWKKSQMNGYDILMLPFLNKIGLYRHNERNIKLKKQLLLTISPAMLCSIILPLLSSLIYCVNGYRSEIICHTLLCIPILVWIACLVWNYSFNWLKFIN